jgi:hypothetical protein
MTTYKTRFYLPKTLPAYTLFHSPCMPFQKACEWRWIEVSMVFPSPFLCCSTQGKGRKITTYKESFTGQVSTYLSLPLPQAERKRR